METGEEEAALVTGTAEAGKMIRMLVAPRPTMTGGEDPRPLPEMMIGETEEMTVAAAVDLTATNARTVTEADSAEDSAEIEMSVEVAAATGLAVTGTMTAVVTATETGGEALSLRKSVPGLT